MVKVEIDREKYELHAEGNIFVITAELMTIIEDVVNKLCAKDEKLKEFAKRFLIESIGEL